MSFEPVPATTVARPPELVHAGLEQAQLLLVVEGRRLAGRAGDHDAVGAVVDQMAHQAAGGALVDGAAVVERRHHRGQDRARVRSRRTCGADYSSLAGCGRLRSTSRSDEGVEVMADDLMFQPVTELAASVREGDVSARELVETSLQAIERLNGELNAFVTLCEERALAEADAIEPGDSRPLAGIPIAIKDLVALTEGVRTTMGMNAMEEWVPSADSALVRRLREAGAIVVGKTNTPEMGILPVTEPQRFGPARNPWDTSRTTGRLLGRQRRGGGVRHGAGRARERRRRLDPHPGVVLRAGRPQAEPRAGVAGAASSASSRAAIAIEGCVSRTVADTALILDVISGYEPGDPYWAPDPSAPFVEAVERNPGTLRIAYATASPTGVPVHEDCAAAVRRDGGAARVARPHGRGGAGVRDERYVENFIKIWTAGVADEVHTYGRLRGAAARPRQARAAHARDGRARGLVEGRGLPRGARLPAPDGAAAGRPPWSDLDVLLTPTVAQPPLPIGALAPKDGEPAIPVAAERGRMGAVHAGLERHRPARDLAAAAPVGGGAADRRAARRAARRRGAAAVAGGAARGRRGRGPSGGPSWWRHERAARTVSDVDGRAPCASARSARWSWCRRTSTAPRSART